MRHIYLIDEPEKYWYSAESVSEVREMFANDFDPLPEGAVIRQLPDDAILRVTEEHGRMMPIEATCRHWADMEVGLIASTTE